MANSILNSVPQGNQQTLQQIKQFGSTVTGDPRAQVMAMLSRGQISNAQLQQAMQMAKQMQKLG